MAPPDWTVSDHRRHLILNTLFKAAEQQGIRVKQPDRFTAYLEASGERINFKLREKQKQVWVQKSSEAMKHLLPGEKTWRQELTPRYSLVLDRDISPRAAPPSLERHA